MTFGLLGMEWYCVSFIEKTKRRWMFLCYVWVDVAGDVTSGTIEFSLDLDFSHWWERGRQVRHPLSS